MMLDNNVPSLVDQGVLFDMKPLMDEAGVTEDLVAMGQLSVDGGVYGMPNDIAGRHWFYRKDLYEEHGLDPENLETWDDYIEAGSDLPDDTFFSLWDTNRLSNLFQIFLRQTGDTVFTEDNQIRVHSDNGVRVAEMMRDVIESEIVASAASMGGSSYQGLQSGNLISVANGTYHFSRIAERLPDLSGQIGATEIPAITSGGNTSTRTGGGVMLIPAHKERPEQLRAFDFLRWSYATRENAARQWNEFGLFPRYSPAYPDLEFPEPDYYDDPDDKMSMIVETIENIPEFNSNKHRSELADALNNQLNEVVQNGKDPYEALLAAAEDTASSTSAEVADL
jgi:multiple sugar transport system substrate-binding protein/lactose/L-arabinose transport system substrate-binding protein